MINPAIFKTQEGFETVKANLQKRFYDTDALDKLQTLYKERSDLIASSEGLQNKRNVLSKEIGQLQSQKTGESAAQAEKLKQEVKELADELKTQKDRLGDIETAFQEAMLALPNLLDESVPQGEDEKQNVEVRRVGEIPAFSFDVLPHFEIAELHNLLDFERGVKLAGSRFYIYNEQISALERKLINFMLNEHALKNYKERTVPYLVRDEAMMGTGQFPKFADEYYRLDKDELSLIPTAEVPLTNMYADEILDELPVYLTSATACFRREAGSAGKDTRGLVRVHQFMKVELVKFVDPKNSAQELEALTNHAEAILQKLGLTYRVVLLCSGDTSFSSSKTYDLEIWMPGLKRWLEISSCSNFQDFQARRAKIRYKDKESGKNNLVHTLNGSGVAAGRLVAALLEYHQTPDKNIDWDGIYSKLR